MLARMFAISVQISTSFSKTGSPEDMNIFNIENVAPSIAKGAAIDVKVFKYLETELMT